MNGTDLGDLYRGSLSLRQVWVRVLAVSMADPQRVTPLNRAIDDAQAKAAEAKRVRDLDDVMNRYRKG